MSDSRTQQRAILIVDHGTRNASARRSFAELAEKVSTARPDWLVEHAHMELAEPSFEAGIDALVSRGATHIYVHLHFLGEGFHVRESIPELVTKANQRHTTIVIETGEPLGHDPRIVELVVDRMDHQLPDDRQSSKE